MKMWFDIDTNRIVTEDDLWTDFLYLKYHYQYEIEDYLALLDNRYLVPIANADRFAVKEDER